MKQYNRVLAVTISSVQYTRMRLFRRFHYAKEELFVFKMTIPEINSGTYFTAESVGFEPKNPHMSGRPTKAEAISHPALKTLQ